MIALASSGQRHLVARRVFLCLSTILCAGWVAPATAQDLPDSPLPPEREVLDRNGVNLAQGSVVTTGAHLSIGSGDYGFSYNQITSNYNYGLYVDNTNAFDIDAVFDGSVTKFIYSSGTYSTDRQNGETLTVSGSTYTLTRRNGDVYTFDLTPLGTGQDRNYYHRAKLLGVLTQITRATGEVLSFHYAQTDRTVAGNPRTGSHVTSYARLQSVTNSSGYQLKFTYLSNSPTAAIADWVNMTKVTAINNAVDYCDPSADTCGTFTQTWPTLSFATTTSAPIVTTVTDSLGRITTYGYDSAGRLSSITRPASTTPDEAISYDTNSRVSSITKNGATWGYVFSLGSTTMTATVTNPDSSQRVIVSDLTVGLPTSVQNELSKTTAYTYDTAGRILTATLPEGGAVAFAYDSRGNLTQKTFHAKTGSGLADITSSASYPSSCTNVVTCNKPTSTTDAHGNVTAYTYDGTHGGVLTVTRPAIGGVSPQVRYSYSALQAYYKNSSGAIVASGASEYRLTGTSMCRTYATCTGTDDETKMAIGYGSTGVANNLLATSMSASSGSGSLVATTTTTYDVIGNVLAVDGPLAGSGDTTTYRYDADRELVGAISPDPDGAGSMSRRAIKKTYDADGRATLVETGTVGGTSDTDWSAFSAVRQVSSSYDVNGYRTLVTASAGGVTTGVQQTSYDTSGRIQCSAARLNSATWSSLPTSACTLGTTGTFGPDRITKITYDAAGHATKVQTAYGTADQADEATGTFSDDGKLTSLTDGQGNLTTFEYDGFDRIAKTRYPVATVGAGSSSTSDYEQLVYDAGGSVVSRRLRGYATDTTQHIDYAYDALNRLTTKTLPNSEPAVAFSYDNFDHAINTYTSSNYVTITYDALGRAVSQTSPLGSVGMAYDLAGRRTSTVWPDAFYVTYDRLTTGEIVAIRENGATSGAGVLATYSYDTIGRLVGVTRGNGTTTSFTFDGQSRLTSLSQDLAGSSNDLTLGLSYSPSGQITNLSRSNDSYAWTGSVDGSTSSTANGLNQITNTAGGTLGYDARGNVSSTGTNSYSYSSENLLVSGPGFTATYDPLMRLYQTSGTTTLLYAYDGSHRIAEYNSSGTVQRRYVSGALGEPLVWYEGAGTSDRRWLHADERGSVVAVSNSSGTSIGTNTYDEYGVPGSSNIGAFQYTGQTWLPDLGAYYYKARIYSSRLGRFMQADPKGYGSGMNLYGYVSGDPVNSLDPSGMGTCMQISFDDGQTWSPPIDCGKDDDNGGGGGKDDSKDDSSNRSDGGGGSGGDGGDGGNGGLGGLGGLGGFDGLGGDIGLPGGPQSGGPSSSPTKASHTGESPFSTAATLTNLIALDGANTLAVTSAVLAKLPNVAEQMEPVSKTLGIAGLAVSAIANTAQAVSTCNGGGDCGAAVGRAAIKTAEAAAVLVGLTLLAPEAGVALVGFTVGAAAFNFVADHYGAYDWLPNQLGL